MCQISSLSAAAEGPVAEFSSFVNFEEKKRKWNQLMSFPKTGNQMSSFGQIRKKSFFCFFRTIIDISGFTLLNKKIQNTLGVLWQVNLKASVLKICFQFRHYLLKGENKEIVFLNPHYCPPKGGSFEHLESAS